METLDKIKKQIAENPILIYMKGSPKLPSCGFSARASEALMNCKVPFGYVDILQHPDIRAELPAYANWPTLRYMLRGNTVSDAPLIIGSLDPCYSCTDRVTVVDVRKRKAKTVDYKEIERYGIERKNSPLK